MTLRFFKYEGLGNDFLVVDAAEAERAGLDDARVARICDRHLGVGGDGVLFVAVRAGRASMRVVNADGSTPEMCGNGLRCVALHFVRTGALATSSFDVDTDAGAHACRVIEAGDAGLVEVTMRPPELAPARVPVRADQPMIDAPFDVDGTALHVTSVSMGNPHAVVFDAVGDARAVLGPRIERDARFPEGVNVGFASIATGGGIDLDVYERGVGWTRACGTGACAAAVAAVETGRAPRGTPIEVRLPGGPLSIVVGGRGEPVKMTGPARFVFEGTIDAGRF